MWPAAVILFVSLTVFDDFLKTYSGVMWLSENQCSLLKNSKSSSPHSDRGKLEINNNNKNVRMKPIFTIFLEFYS